MKSHIMIPALPVVAVALSVGGTSPARAASEWTLDVDHSRVEFAVRHMMVSNVEGNFKVFDGLVRLDEKDVTNSKVNVSIDVSSVDTDNKKRDDHLRSPDFFNAKKYPKMTFASKKVSKKGSQFEVEGDLTLHGVTKPVVLKVEEFTDPIKGPWGNTRRGAVARTTINRTDFGLTWNKALEAGGVVVGEEVRISLQLELIEKSDKKA